MILVRLRLLNFRPYAGRHEIAFSVDAERNTTIVTGATGAGKTSLFYALNWVLYGDEGISDALISRGVANPATASVELEFLHEGKRFVARRVQETDQAGRERERSFTLEELSAGGRTTDVGNPKEFINVVLPRYARRYFFFEAERIRELAKPGGEAQVREAVSSVLKLKVLDRMCQHLDDATKEYARQYQKTQPDSSQQGLLTAVEQLEGTIEKGQARLAKIREDLAIKEEQRQQVRLKLEKFSAIREIAAQEDVAIANLRHLEGRAKTVANGLRLAATTSPALVATAAVETARRILDEKRTRGEVPSGIKQQIVEDLLSQGTCICGRPLDASARHTLEGRHREGVSDVVAEAVLSASGNLRFLEHRADEKRRILTEGTLERARLTDSLLEAQRALEGIWERRREIVKDILAGDNGTSLDVEVMEDLPGLDRTLRTYEQEIKEAFGESRVWQARLDDARAELSRAQARLANLQARSAEEAKAKTLYDLAVKARASAQLVTGRYAADMRRLIEDETNKTFHEFHWKEEQFKRVTIGEDYRLEVVDRWGMNALGGMSDGEKHMVSLAFLTAMTHVTKEEAPVVIDMPIARLSEVPVAHIVEGLPQLTKQLVLLVIDDELDSEARRALARYVGREYVLRFDDKVGHTSIEELR